MMSLFRQLTTRFMLTGFLVLGLAFAGAAQAGQPLLTSQHKHSPRTAGKLQSVESDKATVLTGNEEQAAKSRPAYAAQERGAISSLVLRKKLSARSAIVMDAGTGRTLYAHEPARAAQPASTIKILTGMIAIKALKNDELVPVSKRAAGMPRSKVYLRSGKSYRADDLINAVLLASANDASVALAEKIGGSEQVFANLMTYRAGQLGAQSTVCKTATGLTARGQKSTVKDLAVLFGEAMKNPEFANRMAQAKVKTSFGKVLRNHNKALWQVDGTEGGKTGYTQAARQTYVGKFRREEGELLVALMGSETMWDDVSRLVEYGFLRKKQEAVAMVPVESVESRLAMVRENLLTRDNDLIILSGNKKNSNL